MMTEVRSHEFPDIKIDCLLRDKKGVTFEERIQRIKRDPKYQFLKNHPNIQFIKGDVIEPKFGMEPELFEQYTHIVHSAAEISFSKSVADAIRVNVVPVQRLCEVVKACSSLERVVYVSTAYINNASDEPILETIDMTQDIDELMRSPKPENHPNTYCMSKYMAERWLHEYCGAQYVVIRPSIIGPALTHPYPGFTHQYSSPSVNCINLTYSGIQSHIDPNHETVNVIPIDTVVGDMLDSLIATQTEKSRIVHATSYVDLCQFQMERTCKKHWPNNIAIQTLHSYTRQLLNAILLLVSGKFRELYEFVAVYHHFQTSYFNFQSQHHHTHDPAKYNQLIYDAVDRVNRRNPTNPSIHGFETSHRWLNIPVIHGIFLFMLFSCSAYVPMMIHLMWIYRDALFNEYPWNQWIAKYVMERIFLALFTDITFSGKTVSELERAKSAYTTPPTTIYMSTHRSYFDWLVIPYVVYTKVSREPLTIVANAKFGDSVLVKRLMSAYHVKFVDAEGGDNDRLSFELGKIVKSSGSILFFPEGTRSRDRTFKPFKTGVLQMIHQQQISYTVVPVTITFQRRPEEASLDAQRTGDEKHKPFVDLFGLVRWLGTIIAGSNDKCGRCNAEFGSHFAVEPQKKSVESVVSMVETAWKRGVVVWDEQLGDAKDMEYVDEHGIKRLTHPRRKKPYVMCETERNNYMGW
jgi:fatty acyl-CoA reductase